MSLTKTISIVIPCYNSSNTISQVVERIKQTMETRKEYLWEVILVNDGSKDGTWEVIQNLAKNNAKIKAINFSQNFGQHAAMMAGYRKAIGDLLVSMDDDGENRPEEMFLLIDKLEEGYDGVFAEYESHTSRFRSLGTSLNNWMACCLLDKPKDITITSYYVIRRFVMDQVIRYENSFPYLAGLLLQATKNWGTVELIRSQRLQGKSRYSFRKLLSLWINGFTAFSVKPLRIASAMGGIFSVIGVLWGLSIVVCKFAGVSVALGYTSIMAALCFFGGMIMMLLGIIGEYVGRTYISINNSPQYVIREQVDQEQEE